MRIVLFRSEFCKPSETDSYSSKVHTPPGFSKHLGSSIGANPGSKGETSAPFTTQEINVVLVEVFSTIQVVSKP